MGFEEVSKPQHRLADDIAGSGFLSQRRREAPQFIVLAEHPLEERTAAGMADEQRKKLLLLAAEVVRSLGEEGRNVLLRCGDACLGRLRARGKAEAPSLYEFGVVIVR